MKDIRVEYLTRKGELKVVEVVGNMDSYINVAKDIIFTKRGKIQSLTLGPVSKEDK